MYITYLADEQNIRLCKNYWISIIDLPWFPSSFMLECIQQFSFHFLIIHNICSRIEKCQKRFLKSTYIHPYAIHVVVDLFVYWRPLPYYTYPIISSLLLYYYRLPILPIAFALYWCPQAYDIWHTDRRWRNSFFRVGKQKSITFLASRTAG